MLCNSMNCSPPSSSVHRDSPGKNTRVGCYTFLQGIFPTQGSNTCRSLTLQADSLSIEPPQKPMNTGVGSLSLLQGIIPTQVLKQGLLNCRWILYQLSYQGKPGKYLQAFNYFASIFSVNKCGNIFLSIYTHRYTYTSIYTYTYTYSIFSVNKCCNIFLSIYTYTYMQGDQISQS